MPYPRLAAASAVAVLATSVLATGAVGQAKPPPELRSREAPHLMVERGQGQAFRSDAVEIVLAPATESGSRVEYKVDVGAGDALVYSLSADLPGDLGVPRRGARH